MLTNTERTAAEMNMHGGPPIEFLKAMDRAGRVSHNIIAQNKAKTRSDHYNSGIHEYLNNMKSKHIPQNIVHTYTIDDHRKSSSQLDYAGPANNFELPQLINNYSNIQANT